MIADMSSINVAENPANKLKDYSIRSKVYDLFRAAWMLFCWAFQMSFFDALTTTNKTHAIHLNCTVVRSLSGSQNLKNTTETICTAGDPLGVSGGSFAFFFVIWVIWGFNPSLLPSLPHLHHIIIILAHTFYTVNICTFLSQYFTNNVKLFSF